MKKNRIVVFNHLTESELDDVSLFEGLVGNHYDKFRILYNIISTNNIIDSVNDVTCKLGKSTTEFTLIFGKNPNSSITNSITEMANEIIEYDCNIEIDNKKIKIKLIE